MIGLTGSGKSTLGNCLLNKSGDLDKIKEKPFLTSNDSVGCTKLFQLERNEEIIVIDTIGFGDPQFKQEFVLENLRAALKEVDNKIDCVLFTVNQGRFTNQIVEFLEIIQEKVLKKKCIENSVLISTGGNEKDWIKKEMKTNEFVKKTLKDCNNKFYEFALKFDYILDDQQDREKNIKKRQHAIDNLLLFLTEQTKSFEKIQLSHIQEKGFSTEWHDIIFPLLTRIFSKILNNETLTPVYLINEGINIHQQLNANESCKIM